MSCRCWWILPVAWAAVAAPPAAAEPAGAWRGCRFSYDDICKPGGLEAVLTRLNLTGVDQKPRRREGLRILLSSGSSGFDFALDVPEGRSATGFELVWRSPSDGALHRRRGAFTAAEWVRLNRLVTEANVLPDRPTPAQIASDGVVDEVCLHAAEAAVERWTPRRAERVVINACDHEAVFEPLIQLTRRAASRMPGCAALFGPDEPVFESLAACAEAASR